LHPFGANISDNSNLTEDQKNNLSKGLPWIGMESKTLLELFGEPSKKRILNDTMTRFIWSYGKIFIYVNDNKVAEWKKR